VDGVAFGGAGGVIFLLMVTRYGVDGVAFGGAGRVRGAGTVFGCEARAGRLG